MKWAARDSLAVKEILAGDIPDFFKEFALVIVSILDFITGKVIKVTYCMSPGYLSIDNDWARINITPIAAQKNC